MTFGQHTKKEILTQTEAWVGAIDEIVLKKQKILNINFSAYDQVIFTGCGSTYYLSLAAAALFQKQTGIICKAIPGGELLINPKLAYSNSNNLLVAISRSGTTTETIEAVQQFKSNKGGKVITISNYDNQPLTELSDLDICIAAGQETSVAQTRSFSSMFVASTALAMIASYKMDLFDLMRKLPEIGEKLIEDYHKYARESGENLNFDRFFYLGNGCRYGIACEANLKMKEMTQTHTEPYHFLEFRHGPKSMINEQSVVIGLLSTKARAYEEKVLEEMRELGGRTISIAENDADISFNSGLPEEIRTVLYLPVLQLMAFYRSMKKGLNPDKPKNLSSVVTLK
ncbi:MAG: SIS domain-containing protein [Anaerolineaceae bacterium]